MVAEAERPRDPFPPQPLGPAETPRTNAGRPPAHPVTPRNLYAHIFREQPAEHVREAATLAEWMLGEIEKDPDAYPESIRDVFAEVAQEAAWELEDRNRPPAAGPTPLSADLHLVKERVDIAGYVTKRTGVEYHRAPAGELKTRCPFPDHPDASPSFYVNNAKGTYHCFGCGRGGDLVTFLMEWDGYSFREAVEVLRWEAGLPTRVDTPTALGSTRKAGRREGVIRLDG